MAEGARKVKYKDKEITYHSLEEMERLRDKMKQEILGRKRVGRVYAKFSKGLD